jgi:hypothetical protein
MKLAPIGLMLSVAILASATATAQKPTMMRNDVARMVRAAHKVGRLMPWSKPVAEPTENERGVSSYMPVLVIQPGRQ